MARYSQTILQGLLTALMTIGIPSAQALASAPGASGLKASEDSALGRDVRIHHAKELLGKFYKRSVVREVEKAEDIHEYIEAMTAASLPKKYKRQSKRIAQAIIHEAYQHKFDPLFVMAVVATESGFQPAVVGKDGEIGLMQVMPKTAKWIAKLSGLKYKNKKTLSDPVMNIRIGTAYLARLREDFDSHSRLYLAAYNMGGGNVKKALGRKIWPKEYPVRVMEHYLSFYSELKQAGLMRGKELKRGRAVAREAEEDSRS